MPEELELNADGSVSVVKSNRGGRRPGAGRPKGYSPKKAAEAAARMQDDHDEMDDTVGPNYDQNQVAAKKAIAIARKETALADQAELNYKKDSEQYLPRAAFRDACAQLLATLAQSMRSIPDLLERRHALPPEALNTVGVVINDALADAADSLAMFSQEDGQ